MSTWVILQQMGMIAILVSLGIFLYRRQILDETTSRKLSAVVMDVCNPALIMASILSGNITAGHADLIKALEISVVFYALMVGLGFLLPMCMRVEADKRRFYHMMVVYTNVGFIGIPLARAILPENAILYVIVCNVMYSLLFYTHGVSVLSGGKEKMDIRKIFSPGTVMAILSLLLFWFDYRPPQLIADTVSYIGNATVFLSMILLGANIARSGIRKGLGNVRIWIYIVLRMVLVPLLMVLALKALHMDGVTIRAMCLMAAMPVGNLPMIQAQKMGEDTQLLSNAIAITTLLSLLTVTLLMSLVGIFGV